MDPEKKKVIQQMYKTQLNQNQIKNKMNKQQKENIEIKF